MSDIKAAGNKLFLWNELDLITQITKIVDAYNKLRYKENEGEYVRIAAAYPDYIFDTTDQGNVINTPHKLICYDIVKKGNGTLGENRGSKQKPRPTLMETRDLVINEGKDDEKTVKEEVYAKRYDVTYRFDCLAPSDTESMALIRDFERMMEIHAQYLESGCHRFIYTGRRPSYFNRDTQYKSRSCEFFSQIEEQWFKEQDRINTIEIEYLTIT